MSCSDEYVSHSTEDNLIQITPQIKSKLQKAKYGVYNHSAVELCHWTKKSFAGEGDCYKHKFYGISTHRCMEMTPARDESRKSLRLLLAPNRILRYTRNLPPELVDQPDVIVDNLMEARRKLISGFYGHSKNSKKKLNESLFPAHYAISLSGEPTMYPKLPQLIKYLKTLKATKSIFLVTMVRNLKCSLGYKMKMRYQPRSIFRQTLPTKKCFIQLIDRDIRMPGIDGGRVCTFLPHYKQEQYYV